MSDVRRGSRGYFLAGSFLRANFEEEMRKKSFFLLFFPLFSSYSFSLARKSRKGREEEIGSEENDVQK